VGNEARRDVAVHLPRRTAVCPASERFAGLVAPACVETLVASEERRGRMRERARTSRRSEPGGSR